MSSKEAMVQQFFFTDVAEDIYIRYIPVPGDGEVDERALRLHLGLVVRVGQLRLQDQPKRRVEVDLAVADLGV